MAVWWWCCLFVYCGCPPALWVASVLEGQCIRGAAAAVAVLLSWFAAGGGISGGVAVIWSCCQWVTGVVAAVARSDHHLGSDVSDVSEETPRTRGWEV